MILNLSPLASHLSESLTSLRFATKVGRTSCIISSWFYIFFLASLTLVPHPFVIIEWHSLMLMTFRLLRCVFGVRCACEQVNNTTIGTAKKQVRGTS